MIAAFLRIILLLLPLAAVIMWLRWRVNREGDEAELAADFRRLRTTLIAIAVTMLLAVLGLWLTDQEKGAARTRYVPPHSENGKVVPGHFEPEKTDTAPKKEPEPGDGR